MINESILDSFHAFYPSITVRSCGVKGRTGRALVRTAVPEERRGSESLSFSLMTYTQCEKDTVESTGKASGKVKRVVSGK